MRSILIFVAIVAAGSVLWYAGMYLTRSAAHILPGIVVSEGEMKHVEEDRYMSIAVSYPERTPLKSMSANQRALEKMERWLLEDIEKFKSIASIDQLPPEDRQMLERMQRTYEYATSYRSYVSSDQQLISYQFDIYVDTGGAHPNGYYKTFVFDMEGTEIILADLFEDRSDYLERLSVAALEQVTAELSQRGGTEAKESVFIEGLSGKEENFSNFVIDGLPGQGDTLVILIPPYQAAAYAAGSFEVRIPLSELSDIFREAWK